MKFLLLLLLCPILAGCYKYKIETESPSCTSETGKHVWGRWNNCWVDPRGFNADMMKQERYCDMCGAVEYRYIK